MIASIGQLVLEHWQLVFAAICIYFLISMFRGATGFKTGGRR